MADKAKSEEERQLAKDKVIANTLDNLHFIKTRLGDRVYKMHRVLTGIKSATFARFCWTVRCRGLAMPFR